jgi:flagellin-like hook-associated protein FlgL
LRVEREGSEERRGAEAKCFKIRAASPEQQLNLSQQENGLAGADMPALATNFAQEQVASEATVNATARVLSLPTLLDYLK